MLKNKGVFTLILYLFSFLLIVAFLASCNMFNEPEGGNGGSLTLTVEDVSCTEAWIKLGASGAELPASVKLYANDTLKQTLKLTAADTLIYDEGLLPNRAYAYRAELIKPQKSTVKSKTVTATTLDTTSHDFTWETFTFGGANGSSALYDVAIINENDIWAVGEIHTSWTDQWDSNGVWVQPYNAVHWNGQEWELVRIGGYGYWAYNTVYAFSENDVWFDGTVQWNGQTYTAHVNNFPLEPNGDAWRVYGMWGTSSSDFYIVGQHGNIAHYDGSGWEKIESGTEVNLVDIWGTKNGERIWICGNEDFQPTVLIKLEDNNAKLIFNSRENIFNYDFQKVSGYIRSIWVDSNNLVYLLTSYDLYRIYDENFQKPTALWKNVNSQIATLKVRGSNKNDIFSVGYEGLLCHFNGISWKTFTEMYNGYRTFYSLAIKENIIVVVGKDYLNGIQDKAIISLTTKQ